MREEIQKDGKLDWQWQPGCFDRLLRSDESLQDKWLYVEENAVRAGLVKQFKDWPYRFVFNEGYGIIGQAHRLPFSIRWQAERSPYNSEARGRLSEPMVAAM
jgi:hypothetical protein